MEILHDFDGASVIVLGDPGADGEVGLALRTDNAADVRQWFCFRSWGEAGERRAFRIEDAAEAEYPGGWEGYRVSASYDGEDWFRVATRYEDGALRFRHVPARRGITFACAAAYPWARHRRVIGRAGRAGARVSVREIGETVMGRPISAITFGHERSGPRVWVIARQHPGETMAAWCAEGIVDRLLDPADPVVAALLEEAAITIVPGVNLDGGVLGNHRTNAAGRDLNRSWDAPDLEHTPEVFAVRAAMLETGVDLFLDLHGDETVPIAFAAACEGNPGYSERIEALERGFLSHLAAADPGFSTERGYPPDEPGQADLSAASNWVGERFDCLSLTLELPFKDVARSADRRGWSPRRSVAFGRAVIEAMLASLDQLP